MIQYSLGLMARPALQWQRVAALPAAPLTRLLLYPAVLALLPAVAWYYGTSRVGWRIGGGEAIRLTAESAFQLCTLFYLAMLACIAAVGYFIHWMAETYGSESSIVRGIVVAGLTFTPVFLFGLAGFYPLLWIDLLLGVVAVSWSIYLLYVGIPIMMNISPERGFLFSTAVVGVGLVILVSLMVSTVILWDLGVGPAYTDL